MLIEFIGYMAGVAAATCSLPQIIKMFRTKQVRDVSIWWGILLMFSSICWSVYGIANNLGPIIACNSVIFIQASLIVILKVKYNKKA